MTLVRIAAQVVLCVLVADFLSGLLHWLEDAYGQPHWPITGKLITRPNILHHYNPTAFTHHSWLQSADVLLALGGLILAGAAAVGGLRWQIVLVVAIGVNANEFHKWAHRPRARNPRLVNFLHDYGVLQSPAHHARHHRDPKNSHYCVITSLLNPILDRVGFWSALEQAVFWCFGVKRRHDPSVSPSSVRMTPRHSVHASSYKSISQEKTMKRTMMILLAALLAARAGFAAGTLTPKGSPHAPIQIRDHRVEVVINNGFARTEATQTFFNPNTEDLEAIYSFPLPKSASLSEVTIWAGEQEMNGEVVEREEAKRIYEEERDQGNDAGKADKETYQSFDFSVARVPANGETKVRFVYYQPLAIDTGIGRYVYPLAEGGTDEAAQSFWTRNSKVEGAFAVHLELKSAWPVSDVRVPGYETAAAIDKQGDGEYEVTLEAEQASLERDFVFYYRLADGLPGRVELVPYRAAGGGPGTFMMVVTPGVDLGPITGGADYCFVLDASGSMETKLAALTRGVTQALGQMRPEDRFRIIVFRSNARDLTGGFKPATPENVAAALRQLESLTADDSTNLYAGLDLALQGLDGDRATSIVLVTDGVTNTGVIDPKEFHALLSRYEVRVFGFVMGNSGNWPLMEAIGKASGGFSAGVSNDDDIVGQILLAKSKITGECLHDVDLAIRGIKISDLTEQPRKIYRGQQLVFFGRYEGGGKATVTLKARLTGEDKTYTTTFDFPEVDIENPEIERLWALDRVEAIGAKADAGLLPAGEAKDAIRGLGLAYQLVTDHTSMVILSDATFESRGIEHRNRARVAAERAVQSVRGSQPVRSRRVDEAVPMFDRPSASLGSGGGNGDGGGAFGPLLAGLAATLAGLGLAAGRSRRV